MRRPIFVVLIEELACEMAADILETMSPEEAARLIQELEAKAFERRLNRLARSNHGIRR
jgi:Mg/Co/Ni transporter MgtE